MLQEQSMGTKIDGAQLAVQTYQAKQLSSISGTLEGISSKIAMAALKEEKLGQARRLLIEMKSSIEKCWQRWSQHPAYFHVQIVKIYDLANQTVFTNLFNDFSDINQYKEILVRVEEVKGASEHHIDNPNRQMATEILQYESIIDKYSDINSKIMEHKRKLHINILLNTKYPHIVAAGVTAFIITPVVAIMLFLIFTFSIGCFSGLGLLGLAGVLLFVKEPRGTMEVIEETQSLWQENNNLNPPSARAMRKLTAEWEGNIDNFLGFYQNLNAEYEALLPSENIRV
jgi:hypothetical protein